MNDDKPSPGSKLAVTMGCKCPKSVNNHGKGSGRYCNQRKPLFWINADCKLHGIKDDE